MNYPQALSIQVQSVIYHNDTASLTQAIAAMANAVRNYRNQTGMRLQLRFVYGDSTPEPLLDEQTVTSIQNKYSEYLQFTYRFFGFNSGTAKGHNLMAEDFTGDYLVVMNPDVKVTPVFFLKMLEPFLADEKVGMVEARQTPIEHQKAYNEVTLETDWATTACVLIKKAAYDCVHGFDAKTFFLYCDDVDFSWMLRLNGWKILYQPMAPVFHSKFLNNDGSWIPTKAEVYYSAYAQMLMAYKWSNKKRLEELKTIFSSSSEPLHKKALEDFCALTSEQLPEQLDPEHKVARFVGDYYTENRFTL